VALSNLFGLSNFGWPALGHNPVPVDVGQINASVTFFRRLEDEVSRWPAGWTSFEGVLETEWIGEAPKAVQARVRTTKSLLVPWTGRLGQAADILQAFSDHAAELIRQAQGLERQAEMDLDDVRSLMMQLQAVDVEFGGVEFAISKIDNLIGGTGPADAGIGGDLAKLDHHLVQDRNQIHLQLTELQQSLRTIHNRAFGPDGIASQFHDWENQTRQRLEQTATGEPVGHVNTQMPKAVLAIGGGPVGVARGIAALSITDANPAVDPASGNRDAQGLTAEQWCNAHHCDYRQCAGWAKWRRHQLGLSIPSGNGQDQARSVGLVSSPAELKPGSLISRHHGSYGHVVVVEKVLSSNPPSFQVSEMNETGNDLGGSTNFESTSVVTFHADTNSWTMYRPNHPTWGTQTWPGGTVDLSSA